jgi:hypothetical protein
VTDRAYAESAHLASAETAHLWVEVSGAPWIDTVCRVGSGLSLGVLRGASSRASNSSPKGPALWWHRPLPVTSRAAAHLDSKDEGTGAAWKDTRSIARGTVRTCCSRHAYAVTGRGGRLKLLLTKGEPESSPAAGSFVPRVVGF